MILKSYGEKSHLLQMRGLKQKSQYDELKGSEVASFTDAWIETKALVPACTC